MGKSTPSLTQEGELEHPVLVCSPALVPWSASVATGRDLGEGDELGFSGAMKPLLLFLGRAQYI